MTDPVTPQLRIIDSIHPEDCRPINTSCANALAKGSHRGHAARSGNVIGGQSPR